MGQAIIASPFDSLSHAVNGEYEPVTSQGLFVHTTTLLYQIKSRKNIAIITIVGIIIMLS